MQNSKFKILLLIHSLDLGGAEKQTLSLSRFINKSDQFKSIVYSLYPTKIFFKKYMKKNNIKYQIDNTKSNKIDNLIEFIKKEGVDLVHYQFCGDGGGLFGIYRQIPEKLFKQNVPTIETIRSSVVGNKDCLSSLSVSKYVHNLQTKEIKSSVFYEGIDYPKKLTFKNSKKRVVFYGRFAQSKGVYDFIEIAKELQSKNKNVEFYIVGSGEEKQNIIKKIKKSNIVLKTAFEDFFKFFTSNTICFFPTYFDAFPTTIKECMAYGIPVIAYNTGGISELILDHKTGFLIKPGDKKKAIELILDIFESKDLKKRVIKQSKDLVKEKFDMKKNINSLLNIYKKILVDNFYPKVSIIMPTYNQSKYIKEAITSVIKQTYKNWELIIVNDGSVDNTYDIIKPFLKNKKIKYFENKKNRGIAFSRNIAIKNSSGKYVGHLDSDDILKPNALRNISNVFKHNRDVKYVYSNYSNFLNKPDIIIGSPKVADKFDLNNPPQWSHFGVYDKAAALSVGGFDENMKICEDGYLIMKLSKIFKTHHLNKILYLHRAHETNIGYKVAGGCFACNLNKNCPYFKEYKKNYTPKKPFFHFLKFK